MSAMKGFDMISMTSSFEIRLTRYKSGERRQSGIYHVQAADFEHAVGRAHDFVRGAREADPDAEFAIADIHASGLGGETCPFQWQTQVELDSKGADTASA